MRLGVTFFMAGKGGLGAVQIGFLMLFWLGVGLVLFTTLAPLTKSVQWWVRSWDFPRVHIGIAALVLAGLGVALWAAFDRSYTLWASCVLLACAGYQAARIFPYTSLAATEIALRSTLPKSEVVTAIAANVLMENTEHARMAAVLDRHAPDVVFLMETDAVWIDGLSEHLKRYDTVLTHPADNHYGLVFASNLEVVSAEIVRLADDAAPAVVAELIGPTGPFFFVGLHPRPPVPGNTTIERDQQIRRAALLADRKRLPVVAMGDFNDAAWSYSSQRFKEYGGFRDPRVGRGLLASFDAHSWIMRFPIDQLYLTEGLDLVAFERLEPVGSDHFPMMAKFSVQPGPPVGN